MGMNTAGNRTASLSSGNFIVGWNEYTISSWIKSNVIDSDHGWIKFTTSTDARDRFAGTRYDRRGWLSSNNTIDVQKFGLEVNGIETTVESREFVQTTDLQHIVGRWRSGQVCELFIDNDASNPTATQNSVVGTVTNQPGIIIGRGIQESTSQSFNGIVYEIRIYNAYLSDAEISAIYYGQGKDDIYRGLRYWYKMFEASPGNNISSLRDWSENKLNLPTSNNPTGVETPITYRRR